MNNYAATTVKRQRCVYRNLWATVLTDSFTDAIHGDKASMLWFTAKGGMFSTLCMLLDLPEQKIREVVLKGQTKK
ncbi:hypothetical protein [Edaphobacter dinghuensis]|uniref:Uncharacterized protein n=1 Tax=Edaphobacter dinghuensis TaxID=1560005 RepID=A0A917H948_9BACT|nr:hypothetical protein [Edaphobacter dinghuensis]GGG71995.1 hypothetical protein GCM10011585_12830 [Edaphobacter dinghuensis]